MLVCISGRGTQVVEGKGLRAYVDEQLKTDKVTDAIKSAKNKRSKLTTPKVKSEKGGSKTARPPPEIPDEEG